MEIRNNIIESFLWLFGHILVGKATISFADKLNLYQKVL